MVQIIVSKPGDMQSLVLFGSENMSRLYMLTPAQGIEGIKEKVKETVKEALPMILVSIGVLLLITFVPDVCLFLPRLLGYTV